MTALGAERGIDLQAVTGAAAQALRRSLRGLDWLNFFMANVQTGFGPFIAVYLTENAWTQADIGFALSVGSLVALVAQVPAGALVDGVLAKRAIAAGAVVAIASSALLLAIWPIFPAVLAAELLHGIASCLLGPAITAISLGLVGYAAAGHRFGRNAAFAAAGNGIAAGLMGAAGYLLSDRAIFLLTAALAAPALAALGQIRGDAIDPERARGGARQRSGPARLDRLLGDRRLLTFATCLALFQLANAAMLPLVGGAVTRRSESGASALIAACIVAPQLVMTLMAPWVGRRAERWGRKPMLVIGFATLPLRGVLFAAASSPYLLVAIQLLDGVAAAAVGVMTPLVVADITRGTGRFNLAQGLVGVAVGIGASLSTAVAGLIVDRFGSTAGFLALGATAAAAVGMLALAMPETAMPPAVVAPSQPSG